MMMALVVLTMSFASCNGNVSSNENDSTNDSTEVVVDSLGVDSVQVDTVAVDTANVAL